MIKIIYNIRNDELLTTAKILKYISASRTDNAYITKLQNYYKGFQAIDNKSVADSSKPCNIVKTNFTRIISNAYTGYFMGEPVRYQSDNKEMLSELEAINNYNDEAGENMQLAKDASITGRAIELVYIDSEGLVRFKRLNPAEVILIYDDTLEEELLFAIRFWEYQAIDEQTPTLFVQVYSRNEIISYSGNSNQLTETGRIAHAFSLVPVVVFFNDSDKQGDFESILTLQDAYNKIDSYSVDELEAFSDAYLALSGLEGTTNEDIQDMKNNRVLLLPDDGKAAFLTKNINDTYIENLKNRLVDSIYKTSLCPDLQNPSFGTDSGVAVRYKLIFFNSRTAEKERLFKIGLQRRIELITAYMNVIGSAYDYRDIDMSFSRSLPQNDIETAGIINQLRGIVSNETLISKLSFIPDAKSELERLAAEQSLDDYSFLEGADSD
ncbi:MAG: phage portal protein [Eubacteriales bacterium]|nr:phage portal protein [Eubacteriales bacterium]